MRRLQTAGAGGLPQLWSQADSIVSPLVTQCPDEQKEKCARGVVDWYMRQGVQIPARSVYFFDDKATAVRSFRHEGFNARQVSRTSRDVGMQETVGFCGAVADEVVRER